MKGLNFGSPAEVLTWLGTLRTQIDDAIAAGRDANEPPSRRVLSRSEIGRKLDQAEEAIGSLMTVAYLGMGETPPGAKPEDYEGPPSSPRPV